MDPDIGVSILFQKVEAVGKINTEIINRILSCSTSEKKVIHLLISLTFRQIISSRNVWFDRLKNEVVANRQEEILG
jgi:hypothetical protein